MLPYKSDVDNHHDPIIILTPDLQKGLMHVPDCANLMSSFASKLLEWNILLYT